MEAGADGSKPEVSIVIPIYNCLPFLEVSLTSIARQTLASIEIIAIDDGSTDGSGAWLDAFAAAEPRARVVHLPNGGIVKALNHGLSMARGRYIARMDGDDIAHPERLARQVAFLDAHPRSVCAGTLCRVIDRDGRVLHVHRPPGRDRQTDVARFPPFVKTLAHPSLLIRREAMDALGGYRSFFPHAEDHDLYLRLARLGRVDLMPDVLLDYRVHDEAASSRHRDRQIDSALDAQAVAMIAHRTGRDPLEDGQAKRREDMLADNPGVPSPASWLALKALLLLEHAIDRRDMAGARGASAELMKIVSAQHRALWKDRSLLPLLQRAMRDLARLCRGFPRS